MLKNMNFSKMVLFIGAYFLAILLISNYVCSFYIVEGQSMMPNVKDRQIKLVNKTIKKYNRGDIAIVADDSFTHTYLIKRVIGLPGDKVEYLEGNVYINDKKLEEPYIKYKDKNSDILQKVILKNDEYYVLGDNRPNSADSRFLGPIKKEKMVGRCVSFK